MQLSNTQKESLLKAVTSNEPVSGYTHEFYRYPARFAPIFAKSVIEIFTEPGDIVLDPFMGGATTLVESMALGRRCIGVDINELSAFLGKTKTLIFQKEELDDVLTWAKEIKGHLNLHKPPVRAKKWIEAGYQRNINSRQTWPTRKTIELILSHIEELPKISQRMFARCALMKTSQWALDCTYKIPPARDFREKYIETIEDMKECALDFAKAAFSCDKSASTTNTWRSICLNRSVIGMEEELIFRKNPPPKLILTSPPYPGVHVLYHRWQIRGRKETPAPFWIANAQDGHGSSYYTFGGRKQKSNKRYFEMLANAYKSIAKIADNQTLLVQMVGFSKPELQIPRYIETMEELGFEEFKLDSISNMPDGRLWRSVPNRKWYAENKRSGGSSKEVVLFHMCRAPE